MACFSLLRGSSVLNPNSSIISIRSDANLESAIFKCWLLHVPTDTCIDFGAHKVAYFNSYLDYATLADSEHRA
jgi:hypothetical protein